MNELEERLKIVGLNASGVLRVEEDKCMEEISGLGSY